LFFRERPLAPVPIGRTIGPVSLDIADPAAVGWRTEPSQPDARPVSARRRSGRGRVPARIRLLVFAAVVVTLGLVALLTVEIRDERDGLAAIGDRAGPAVVATSDLYFALNDMDAQIANVLLVAEAQKLGFTRAQALDIYEQRRQQVDRDLEQAAQNATDPASKRAIEAVLDSLGRYEALAAQTILLDQQINHPAGHPTAATLARYRQTTDLLKGELLPAAQRLTDQHAQELEATYQTQRARTRSTRTAAVAVGATLLAILLALQIYLTRRFRRLLNPALVGATVLAAVGTLLYVGLLSDEAEHLWVAKKDAFDSIVALTRARAVSYDANADESRYLVDPDRAGQYQQAFLDKSQQLVTLTGATLTTWDRDLAAALAAYQRDQHTIGWTGYLGTEFRNITFTGERAQAETTVLRYQTYQLDDRRIRAMTTAGQLNDAIAFCTSYAPGASNYAFDQYDQALAGLIATNQHAFDQAINDGQHELGGKDVVLWVGAVAVLALLVAGAWPRLREYR
jgi:hypothetical protein